MIPAATKAAAADAKLTARITGAGIEMARAKMVKMATRGLDIEQEVLDSEVVAKIVNDGDGGSEFLANESRRLGSESTGASAYTRAKVWWRKS